MSIVHLKLIAELKTVLLEREHIKPALTEIAVELVAGTGERPLVEMPPYRRHSHDKLRIAEVIVDNQLQVFVHSKHRDGIQVRQHIIEHGILVMARKGVAIEFHYVGFLKLLYRHHQHWHIHQYLYLADILTAQVGTLERLTQVGSHRHAALHHIGLKGDRRRRQRRGYGGKRQAMLTNPDNQAEIPLILFYFHIFAISLPTPHWPRRAPAGQRQ